MRRSAVGATLTLLVMALSGCNSGSELSSNAVSPASNDTSQETPAVSESAPEDFPSPSVEGAPASASTVALVRPTDPEARVRVIKSGRTDPFRPLVSPVPTKTRPQSGRTGTATTPRSGAKTGATGRSAPKTTVARPSSSLTPPKSSSPKPAAASAPDKAVLPPLPAPEPTTAKEVQVQGIVVMAGRPQAIVKAPEEKTARTISVGDRVANGRVVLKAFDMSDSVAPKAIFEEAGMEVAIGVGQPPIVLASASLPAVPGLYKVTSSQ